MFKFPHDKDMTIVINDQSIAPVIAAAFAPPFAYVASSASEIEYAREIFENCNFDLGTDVTVTSRDQLDEKVPIYPEPITFLVGQNINIKSFTRDAANLGYTRVARIENPAEFNIRGDTADIWPLGSHSPIRIMFFGDEIEAIKSIDPDGFSTVDVLKKCLIPPIKETCHIDNWQTVSDSIRQKFPLVILEEQTKIKIQTKPNKEFKSTNTIEVKTAPVVNFFSSYSILVPEILWNIKTRGATVLVYVGKSRALTKYLDTKGIQYIITTPDNIQTNQINIFESSLGASFELVEQKIVVYSIGSPKPNTAGMQCLECDDSCMCDFVPESVGALVIHEKHGLGRYLGIKKMTLGDSAREYFILQYDGGTFVYLPTEQAHQLYNYNGSPRRLDRI